MRKAALVLAGAALCAELPRTKVDNVKETLHGVEVTDPYRWLEDQTSPQTRSWLDAQNAYMHSVLGTYPGRDKIRNRLLALARTDRLEMPTARGGRYFFRKRQAGQEQFLLMMRDSAESADQLLIDPATAGQDVNTSVDIQDVSIDGKLMAYSIRDGGQDEIVIKTLQVDTRENLRDVLPKRRYIGVNFMPDKSGLIYAVSGDGNPRVYEHKFGDDPKNDRAIFGEGLGPENILWPNLGDDGRYLLIHVFFGAAGDKIDLYVKDLKTNGPIRPIAKGLNASFLGQPGGERIYVKTDYHAPRGRVLAIDPRHPEESSWREVIPEAESPMESVRAVAGKLYVTYLEDVKSELKVFDANGKFLRQVALPGIGSVDGPNGDWTGKEAFYSFNSFHVPPEIRRIDTDKDTDTVWAPSTIPVQPANFDLRQVFYKSKDGTRVPMFLLSRKGVKPNGDLPVLLTGYGGFSVSMTPSWSTMAIPWAEAGGVFAVANLRGGAEYGEEWHHAGMLERKQNVFDDFIGAAEWLIANKYTSPKRLAISGGSNGGLLVGAAMTQRPELFQAVACGVPLLDMVRYHKFLVAKFWVPEYGSADDPKQFPYLLKYSPYHNVKRGVDYPATIFITGDGDTRVAPLHARKMAALVQASTSGKRPILLHYDTKAGHSTGVAMTKLVEDNADRLLFLMTQTGLRP
jgi:prolyl oligopeptidase